MEMKCEGDGTSSPVNWYRYGVDVSNLGDTLQVQVDGTLLIKGVELFHSGNYSCRHRLMMRRANGQTSQAYKLSVHSEY